MVTESLSNRVHSFLDRLEMKNIIQLSTEKRPYTLSLIRFKIQEAKQKYHLLTVYEKEELKELLDYYEFNDFRLFPLEIKEDKAKFFVLPIAGYTRTFLNENNNFERVGGSKVYIAYNDNFSIYAHLQDRGEFGKNIDKQKRISPERVYEFQNVDKGIEYSDVISGIGYDWKWGNFSLIKDYNIWGHGEFGQLILSDKVNSFPHIYFEFNPSKKIRFKYLFGWLNSKVIDSNYYYDSYPGSLMNEKIYNYIDKFIVANLLTLEPWNFLKFSAGNSIIYSGKSTRLEMLLPFAFYKYLDRDVGKGQVSDGNGQLYFDIAFKPIRGLRLYSTVFIDVISLRKTFKGNYIENWIAYTLGLKTSDILINNTDFTIEYTKVEPWVYEHKDITTTYKHLNTTLGHWIGQNAYLIASSITYYYNSKLDFTFKFNFMKKGGEEDIYYAYEGRDEKSLGFLYPPIRKDIVYDFTVNYSPLVYLSFFLNYRYSIIKDDLPGRTPLFFLGNRNTLKIGFIFGLPY